MIHTSNLNFSKHPPSRYGFIAEKALATGYSLWALMNISGIWVDINSKMLVFISACPSVELPSSMSFKKLSQKTDFDSISRRTRGLNRRNTPVFRGFKPSAQSRQRREAKRLF
jgi:hypothetical protein